MDAAYESELTRITHSGPHPIDEERRQKNREVCTMILDILPINDIHKVSDCDLIYKFLIARRWDCEAAAKGLRDYATWRTENKLNEIMWEEFPPETRALACEFRGFDRFGHPVFYDKPDPKLIADLLTKFPRELLLRIHFKVMEWGRRLCKQLRTDRVSCVLDLSMLTMGIVTNTRAIGFMKEMSHMDQQMYPENMRTMLICNGGWSFNAIWKIIRPLLDERVQKKIQFMGTSNMAADIDKWVSLDQVPVKFGGSDVSNPRLDDDAHLATLPVGTPPVVQGVKTPGFIEEGVASRGIAAAESPALNAPPNFASPLLDGAEYDSDEFHSIPSSDDEAGSGHDVYVAASPDSGDHAASRELRYKVSAPLGDVASCVIQMVITNEQSPRGARISTCHVNGEQLFETSGNLIVSKGGHLAGEILAESGHPMHTFLLITNDKRECKFILKRRNLHKKIHIYTVTGDIVVQTTKKMKHSCKGERSHVMTCREGTHSADRRDWCIVPEGQPTKKCQAEKRGDVVAFHDHLPRYELPVLFALAVACTELWHFQE